MCLRKKKVSVSLVVIDATDVLTVQVTVAFPFDQEEHIRGGIVLFIRDWYYKRPVKTSHHER